LSLAALYHDGATPAFGHLFEEFLGQYGFDHESALVKLLQGAPDELPGREYSQVFLGQKCKLPDILPPRSEAGSPLTASFIADLAAGKGPLGRLIKGDIDLDNVDNVLRAATAMGLLDEQKCVHPYEIADALVWEQGIVRLDPTQSFAVSVWRDARRRVYAAILDSPIEFRVQTALKWAIEECARGDTGLASRAAWRLTEPMLVFEHLRKVPFARMLVDRIRLGNPPKLLFSAWIHDLRPVLGRGGADVLRTMSSDIAELTQMDVYINYYVDKRERSISMEASLDTSLLGSCTEDRSMKDAILHAGSQPSGIVGAIAISRAVRHDSRPDGAEDVVPARRHFTEGALSSILKNHLGFPARALSIGWIGSHEQNRHSDLRLASE